MQRFQGDATRGLWPTEMGKTQGKIGEEQDGLGVCVCGGHVGCWGDW